MDYKVEDLKRKNGFIALLKKNITGWVLILPFVVLFICLHWYPIICGFVYSFFDLKGFTPVKFVGFDNMVRVFNDSNFLKTLWNTVQYVLWSLLIGLPIPIIVSVLLNEMVYAKTYFKVSLYLPVLIPGVAACLIWKNIYGEGATGLINMFLALVGKEPMMWLADKNKVIMLLVIMSTWKGFGSSTIMYLATLQGINQELYEAAKLDGAGILHRVRYVLLPHIGGTVLLVGVRQIIAVFGILEQPMMMTDGGPNGASLSLALTNWRYAFKFNQYENSFALGVIMFLMVISLTFVYNALDKKLSD